jgi:hypothetical protein
VVAAAFHEARLNVSTFIAHYSPRTLFTLQKITDYHFALGIFAVIKEFARPNAAGYIASKYNAIWRNYRVFPPATLPNINHKGALCPLRNLLPTGAIRAGAAGRPAFAAWRIAYRSRRHYPRTTQ